MRRFNFFLDPETLQELSNIDELSAAEHIRRAIEQYLRKIRRQPKSSPTKQEVKRNGTRI